MDGWTIGADIGTILTGVAVVPTAGVWLGKQWHGWRATRSRRCRLLAGQRLLPGESLHSPDGRTRFSLQADANMVVTVEGFGVFDDTATVGTGVPKCLRLERDGWLVLYGTNGRDLWKRGPVAARLEVQDNAHVVLYAASGKAIWATNWLLICGQPAQHTGPGNTWWTANGFTAVGQSGK